MTELAEEVAVAADLATVFDAATDWAGQRKWVSGSTVRVIAGDGRGVGSRLDAVTGFGRLGLHDIMEITRWEPPYLCEVRHVGRIVRGTGLFEVRPGATGAAGAVFRWVERLELPFGWLGRVGWVLVRPAFRVGLRRSLSRFREYCEGKQQ